ncbi:fasciclin domain-containing protein [Colletotrichum orchidophilum]|uniref:Fasciclin domain-containing protein n=1 Tax=Colletotrichum orchidophilum TaxID=1209926 RepID=A0A1G4B9T1_9PEZI|nr:fasciclin domain-containing protein [Colletotrichum orchidophilum]OHE98149.1 fasciclin domain-containing protein [Colletotrichum orchidophilum]
MMRLFTNALWATVGLAVSGISAVAAQGLEEVLSKQANLTTFRGLVKDHPDIFSKLPESGVTILAPIDSAYLKGQGWDANKDAIAIALQYGILTSKVALNAFSPGDSRIVSTRLTDARFSNVTGGQTALVTKQPNNDVVITSGVASRTTVLQTDVPFDGGLIQIIDSLMVPPARLETTARDAYQDLTAFLGALYTAELVADFAETPNVTIFAPRNAAFQQVAGSLAGLSKEALRRVLQYHLVPSRVVQASSLTNGTEFATAAGNKSLDITLYNNDIFVNSARLIQTNILIANGVVQMIDAVLNVDTPNVVLNVTAVSQSPVFTVTGAVETGTAAPTPFISALPCTVSCPVSGGGSGGGGTGGTATGGVAAPSSSSGGVAAARGTGLAGAAAAGAGLSLAMGLLGMEALGVIA